MNSSAKETTAGARPKLLSETLDKIQPIENPALRSRIEQRLNKLTAPAGSLGRLEQIILQYGLATDQVEWLLPRKSLFVFCADHGVVAEDPAHPSSAAYPMVRNLAAGRAAANVLCRQYDIDPVIVDMGVNHIFEPTMAVIDRKLGPGTKNFLHSLAMSREQAVHSIEIGIRLAQAANELGYRLLGTGGIAAGNTIAVRSVIAVMTRCEPAEIIGSEEQEAAIVSRVLDMHRPDANDPLAVLTAVGGFEIGGLAGFLLGAAAARIPVCIDGLVAAAAALLAVQLSPNLRGYLIFGHLPDQAMTDLNARPLLDLDMQGDAGVGAAMTIGIVESALRLYREIAPSSSLLPRDKYFCGTKVPHG